eukprot:gene17101-22614_t
MQFFHYGKSLNKPLGNHYLSTKSIIKHKSLRGISGTSWDEQLNSYGCKVLGNYSPDTITPTTFSYLGDLSTPPIDAEELKRKANFNLNVGRALEGLRRELPLVFIAPDLDFSIFSQQITIIDGGQRHIEISKNFYMTIVKSLRIAASFSSIYPSMNVRKIEYIEDCRSIQCLVNVVLPDSVRVDGQSVWEGMFYFGLNEEGLIKTHVFDRKISAHKPNAVRSNYPWLRPSVSWTPELVSAMHEASTDVSYDIPNSNPNNDNDHIDFSYENQ